MAYRALIDIMCYTTLRRNRCYTNFLVKHIYIRVKGYMGIFCNKRYSVTLCNTLCKGEGK